MAVYLAVLKPTDRVMGMNLQEGGHLTHGSLANFSGILYNFKPYGLDEHGYIDFDEFRKNAKLYEPKLIVCGASSYPRIIDFYKFKLIADEVGALLMADISHIAGLIVAGLHPSPFPYCDFVTTTTHKTLRGARGGIIMCKKEFASKIDRAVFPNVQGGALQNMIAGKAVCFKEAMSPEFKDYQLNVVKNAKALANELIDRGFNLVTGHTDTHMMLIDLRNKGITGKDASDMLDKVNITVNKNVIPNDTKSPFVTSGIRIGTPAVTTRGFTENEMVRIADLIDRTLKGDIKQLIKNEVVNLCNRFPIYKGVYFES
jgi:glycine hydroxymethyltransferase